MKVGIKRTQLRNSYKKINKNLKVRLLSLLEKDNCKIKDAAALLEINYNTAKTIWRNHKMKTRLDDSNKSEEIDDDIEVDNLSDKSTSNEALSYISSVSNDFNEIFVKMNDVEIRSMKISQRRKIKQIKKLIKIKNNLEIKMFENTETIIQLLSLVEILGSMEYIFFDNGT